MALLRRIDAHHHVWDLAARDQEWTNDYPTINRTFLFDELMPELRSNNMSGSVAVQTGNIVEETHELLDLAERSPAVLGVVGWTDLTSASVTDDLAALKSRPGGEFLVGLRHIAQGDPDEEWFAREPIIRGFRELSRSHLTYDFLTRHQQIGGAIVAAQAVPEQRFVLDHFGKPPIAAGEIDSWAKRMRELAACENVAIKFSGLVTEGDPHHYEAEVFQPYVDVVLNTFGPARMMFGSDWPVCQIVTTYGEVLALAEKLVGELSPIERADIFGGTADRWYGLGAS